MRVYTVKDITGQRFGQLTAITASSRRTSSGNAYWFCRCDCGKEFEVSGRDLRMGRSTRCRSCANRASNIQHGATCRGRKRSRLYGIWSGIKVRCYVAGRPDADRYYDRGIVMCEEWRDSYIAFRDWALVNGYREELTLDRWPDKNGNYEPSNCRWATWKQQNRNRRDNVMITAFNQTKTIADWTEDTHCKVSEKTLRWRISSSWPAEIAISSPKMPGHHGALAHRIATDWKHALDVQLDRPAQQP